MLSFKSYLSEQEKSTREFGLPESKGVTVKGIHYSKNPGLKELHGYRWGTGIKGAEQKRLQFENDNRLKTRVYFYNQKSEDHLPIAEAGLGPHVHTSVLHGIYDPAKASPEEKQEIAGHKLKHLPDGYDESDLATAFEKAVVDSHYAGYTNGNITVVLNHKVVPTTYKGPVWDLKKKPVAV